MSFKTLQELFNKGVITPPPEDFDKDFVLYMKNSLRSILKTLHTGHEITVSVDANLKSNNIKIETSGGNALLTIPAKMLTKAYYFEKFGKYVNTTQAIAYVYGLLIQRLFELRNGFGSHKRIASEYKEQEMSRIHQAIFQRQTQKLADKGLITKNNSLVDNSIDSTETRFFETDEFEQLLESFESSDKREATLKIIEYLRNPSVTKNDLNDDNLKEILDFIEKGTGEKSASGIKDSVQKIYNLLPEKEDQQNEDSPDGYDNEDTGGESFGNNEPEEQEQGKNEPTEEEKDVEKQFEYLNTKEIQQEDAKVKEEQSSEEFFRKMEDGSTIQSTSYNGVKYCDIYEKVNSAGVKIYFENSDPKLKRIAKHIKLTRQEKPKKSPPSDTGKLDKSRLIYKYRDTKQTLFSKKDIGSFIKELTPPEIVFLIDISGSTASMTKTGRLLYQDQYLAVWGAMYALINSNIPCAAYTHTTEGKSLVTHVASYNLPGVAGSHKQLKERFNAIENLPNAGNSDADAVFYVSKNGFTKKKGKKILIVVSDGKPTQCYFTPDKPIMEFTNGYYSNAKDFLSLTVNYLRSKDMKIFGIATSKSVVRDVQEIYGEEFAMDCSDTGNLQSELNKLMTELTKRSKR